MLDLSSKLFSPLFWRQVLAFRFNSESQIEVGLNYFQTDLEINLAGIVFQMISNSELQVTVTHFNRYTCIYVQGVKFQPDDNVHIIKIREYPVTLNISLVQFKVQYLS